ncbi:outer membrane protein OmpA-like peptidoglycan-associated protein [Catalinimonas alkaloidigena]|uniref:OmpA family protein n=1 Tax=Catalinimonas alkaloidigena TaxID=1075417 RepID=UPI0024063EC5|nr:OmpA family protein [Catalinimonas alkaloidigena]MDF9800052.1 outer membrane protein OmpA-like peptidoglycan-associated protein [Catalinimonas alkaloidigena]
MKEVYYRNDEAKFGVPYYQIGSRKKVWNHPNIGVLLLFVWSITCFPQLVIAQGSDGALVDRANKFFELAKNYEAALPLYQQAVDNGINEPMVYYRLGVCYAYAPQLNEQYKGLPYLENALSRKSGTQIPEEIHFYLGQMYHKDIQINKAISHYEKYKKSIAASDKSKLNEVDRQLEICKNALFLISENKGIVIHSFEDVNSMHTEYNPLVTADESMLAYTGVREERGKIVEKIYTSYKHGGKWSVPEVLDVNTKHNVGTAGISVDGQEMLIFVGGENNTGSIYTISKDGKGWTSPVDIGNRVNSRYLESTASITPDGKVLYFASNRPDGLGGMDIYKSERQSDGSWGKAENLGPEINTIYNEDAPFIHPDSKTLFFTSDGHNTMGGTDIFKSYNIGSKWRKPENLGYPINTPTNDNYFTLTANGKMGYFSSERKGGKGGQDIYFFEMPDSEANIPLTLIKGRILAGEELKAVPTQIKVVDVEANQKIDYVYNPDKQTGNYLIILPPGRNYDLIIESEGYLPYTVNVNIPNQTYFYELYQEIHLKPIKQFDVVVGQEVTVKNAFYDVNGKSKTSVRQANEAMLVQNDSLDLYDMMESIMAASDTAAYNYLLDLMYKQNPIEDVNFDVVKNENIESAGVAYYYDETGEDNLIAKKVGNETIYSLPTFYVTEEAVKQKNAEKVFSNYDKSLLAEVHKIYFGVGESKVAEKDRQQLVAVMEALKKHPELGVEISGYASPEGDEETNHKLSNERAIDVLNFFNQRGVVRRRIIAKGYGATANEKSSPEESRRVEVRLVDIQQYQQ